MSFDEQPDGDIHGECAAEIHRLEQWQNEASAMLATFIGLSSRPDEFEWSKVAIKVPALLAEEGAYKTDSELQIDRAEAKDQLDACRPYLKDGETAADALIRMQKEITTLRNAAMRLWGDRSICDKEDAARYRWLLEHPTFAVHCFIYLPGHVSAEIDKELAAHEVDG